MRALFKWLCRHNHLLANPAADLDLPRAEKRLPKHVLTASEAERVLGTPDVGAPLGLRDRAMLEALYVDAAEIGKTGACHLFRHTCATLMLEGGADIRFIQQLLGHEKLETTQIYAQVSIRMLKEVHARTHPARLTLDATDWAQPGVDNVELASGLAEEEAELAEETG